MSQPRHVLTAVLLPSVTQVTAVWCHFVVNWRCCCNTLSHFECDNDIGDVKTLFTSNFLGISMMHFTCVIETGLFLFSALTLLFGRQEEHLACKNWVMRCWRGYLSEVRCRWFAYGPANATATLSSLASLKSRLVSFLLPAHPGCPGKESVKWLFVFTFY